ncbi:MAG: hypothetical protein ACP5UQ_02360 [Anaerolineae bacterium]
MEPLEQYQHPVRPAGRAPGAGPRSLRLSRSMAILLVACLVCLFVAGFLPIAWTTPDQARASGLNQTVPTRTPAPTLSHRIYLPIVARSS